ncbi:alpha/beta fold hydrolase [Kribbella shirazensis]|uniref:prolyl aminopeptidase n=1 Tax=Kribbella shirazensis TaxID=1105143 RepID=A0A7X6A070_9ACTN|nr:alpha/beta fold hydrolase [Kribbella shirazensis]NIK56837.1 pimeloyl-ACP methyl ester carboxylesterase [Kribbella shirazensis]
MRIIRLLCAVLLVATTATACSGKQTADSAPCIHGFTCTTLHVPLDRQRADGPSLDLAVVAADNVDAPRGVLLLLTGGPGQPGAALVTSLRRNVHPDVLREYRLVMFDQRGTGSKGINCPSLQGTVGGSDFLTPPAAAVDQCAQRIGQQLGYYGTPDTVDDIEQLREHLDVDRLTLDGTSYGSFTAAQYGLKYPDRVQALVLDSVVPHKGFDPMGVDLMAATAGVLRAACRQDPACTTDPVADLAWLVQHGVSGTDLMETLSVASLNAVNPSLKGIPAVLHAARNGDDTALKELFQQTTSKGLRFDTLSAGLHLATLCSDLRFPWSGKPDRRSALDEAVRRLDPKQLYPYDVATARNQLMIQGCLRWPDARVSTYPPGQELLPRTLILHGSHDLFCPLDWANWEKAHAREAELVVVPGSGHSVQRDPRGREAVRTFLLK